MTEEQQLKVTCLELCKGNLPKAMQAYDWLAKPKATSGVESTHTLRDGRVVRLSPNGTWALMGVAAWGDVLG